MKPALLLVHLRLDGVSEKTYRMPDGTKQTILDVKVPEDKSRMTLISQMWDEMDRVTEPLAQGQGSEYDKGYARGVAAMLALFMVPHFTTPDEIVREAVKRYKAKAANEEYETPGLGSRNMEPPPGSASKYVQPGAAKPAAAKAPKTTAIKLSQDDINGIKAAGAMFSPEQLSGVYKVPVDTIRSILAGA